VPALQVQASGGSVSAADNIELGQGRRRLSDGTPIAHTKGRPCAGAGGCAEHACLKSAVLRFVNSLGRESGSRSPTWWGPRISLGWGQRSRPSSHYHRNPTQCYSRFEYDRVSAAHGTAQRVARAGRGRGCNFLNFRSGSCPQRVATPIDFIAKPAACHAEGRGFEPRRSRQSFQSLRAGRQIR
jgi:hypothetical protein